MNVIETDRWLPNTDALTGQLIVKSGLARNIDEARSGLVFLNIENLTQYHYPTAVEPNDFLVIDRIDGNAPENEIKINDAAARLLGEKHASKQEVADYMEVSNITMKIARDYLDSEYFISKSSEAA